MEDDLQCCTQKERQRMALPGHLHAPVPGPLLLGLLAFLARRRVPCPATTQDSDQGGTCTPSSPPHLSESHEQSLKKQRPAPPYYSKPQRVCGISILISKVDNLCTLKSERQIQSKKSYHPCSQHKESSIFLARSCLISNRIC